MHVAPDIIQVQIPLPFALKIVNCYLVRGPAGWALVDTGINWLPALEAWERALDAHGLRASDIRAIYVTHYHPDHIGLAGWWQQRSGAPVLMTPIEQTAAQEAWGGAPLSGPSMFDIFRQHGMPAQAIEAVAVNVARTRAMLDPLPTVTALDLVPAQPLALCGRPFQPLILEGHADAQLALYEAATGTLLVADHVLVKISPNISYGPRPTPHPLARYLASFAQLEALEVATVLPGHGPVFHDLGGRIAQLRAHHAERLDTMAALVSQATTAYDVCCRVFPMPSLTPHQHQFALGETIAHLEQLVLTGRAERLAGEVVRYRA
jgi:glyoxylase-like metal-dependent hydrolase (beta-lactamase superfamily II)